MQLVNAAMLSCLLACGFARLFVPTVVDFSATSLLKDVAHLAFGAAVVQAIWTRDKVLHRAAWLVALWELVAAIIGVGGRA